MNAYFLGAFMYVAHRVELLRGNRVALLGSSDENVPEGDLNDANILGLSVD